MGERFHGERETERVFLPHVTVRQFRNLESSTIEFSDRFNLLTGDNGQGKTNLLESIYLLGNLKSFRNARNVEMVRRGAEWAHVEGEVVRHGCRTRLSLRIEPMTRRPWVDGKDPERVSDYLKLLPTVLFTPEDIDIVKGEPERRRRFLDRSIFMTDPVYLRELQLYNRVLMNRNQLLRSGNVSSLDAWDHELVSRGTVILLKRIRHVGRLDRISQCRYGELSGSGEVLSVRYRSSVPVDEGAESFVDLAERFHRELSVRRSEELSRRTSIVGPHRDDFTPAIDGRDSRRYASQGEQRTVALTLRMAELELYEESSGYSPVLLMDDLASELDDGRLRRITEFLEQKNIQIFASSTGYHPIFGSLIAEGKRFGVSHGTVSPL